MTKREMEEVLHDIATYTFPTYTFSGNKYVPINNAKFIRNQARLALGMPTDETLLESMVSKGEPK